jgi:hypothetical protein
MSQTIAPPKMMLVGTANKEPKNMPKGATDTIVSMLAPKSSGDAMSWGIFALSTSAIIKGVVIVAKVVATTVHSKHATTNRSIFKLNQLSQ